MARPYIQHGLTPLRRALRAEGMSVISRRSKVGKAIAQWRADLEAHLGHDFRIAPADERAELEIQRQRLAWQLAQGFDVEEALTQVEDRLGRLGSQQPQGRV